MAILDTIHTIDQLKREVNGLGKDMQKISKNSLYLTAEKYQDIISTLKQINDLCYDIENDLDSIQE